MYRLGFTSYITLTVMSSLRHRLMCRESEGRLNSARLLRAAEDDSDSAYLLELLAFELLLKVALERATGLTAPTHHKYETLFASLPAQTQSEVLRVAGERVGPSALSSNARNVLMDLGANFVQLRYPFERYSHMNELEYAKVGPEWITNGAKIADADFRYHPEELFGLTTALQGLAK